VFYPTWGTTLILVRETTEFGREFHNEIPLTLKNFFLISREVLTCANLNWWHPSYGEWNTNEEMVKVKGSHAMKNLPVFHNITSQ